MAREAVTLDHLSRGRLVLGVGLGIDFWHEFGSFAGEASDDVERAKLLDDGIEIITRLWSGEATTYRGSRLWVDGAKFLPGPVQQPRIPIWAAMLWPATRRGPIRRAARCDGVMPFTGASMTPAAATLSDLAQQLKPMSLDLAIVRRSLDQLAAHQDQLAAKQEQMAKSVATLQGIEQDISQEISSLTVSQTVHIPHKPPSPTGQPMR